MLYEEVEVDDEVNNNKSNNKKKRRRISNNIFTISFIHQPNDQEWLLISDWTLLSLPLDEDIDYTKVKLFILEKTLFCHYTNHSDARSCTISSSLPHQVRQELKSGIKNGNICCHIWFQLEEYPEESTSSTPQRVNYLHLSFYVKKYDHNFVEDNAIGRSHSDNVSCSNFYISQCTLEWMLGGSLNDSDCSMDHEESHSKMTTHVDNRRHNCKFSLPFFLKQISDTGDKCYELNEQELQDTLVELGLKPKLRPYQLQAISWMMERERNVSRNPDEVISNRIESTVEGFLLLPTNYARCSLSIIPGRQDNDQKWSEASMWCVKDVHIAEDGEDSTPLSDICRKKGNLTHTYDGDVMWFNVLSGTGFAFYPRHNGHEDNCVKTYSTYMSSYLSSYCSQYIRGGMLCDEPGLG